MIYHLTGSKDTYITDKIINGTSRAKDSNVGYASTIDMFKLYGESTLRGYKGTCNINATGPVDYAGTKAECEDEAGPGVYNTSLIEKSRGLLYFDLSALQDSLLEITGGTALNLIDDASLKITVNLFDVQGTQVAPTNFTLELWPLSTTFDEGIGDNIVTFGDDQPASWNSASRAGGAWGAPGGDIVTSWTDYNSAAHTSVPVDTQTFSTGVENLELDVTTWVKSHWNNSSSVANHGWILKFSDAEEIDAYSYFVKRFASRHTRNPFLRPKLVVRWENYHLDDRLQFESGTVNMLSVQNFVKNNPTDAMNEAGTGLNASTGNTSEITVKLSRGSWEKANVAAVSQVSLAGVSKDGFYQVSFPAIDIEGVDSDLKTHLFVSGSYNVDEEWSVGSKIIYSGSLDVKYDPAQNSTHPRDLRFSVLDLKSTYTIHDEPVIRLFVRERNLANEPVRIPVQLASQIMRKAYYQIKDTNSTQVLIPFSDTLNTADESTRISSDGRGMYFKFPASVLPRGRTYTIDIAYYDRGERRIFESNKAFRIK